MFETSEVVTFDSDLSKFCVCESNSEVFDSVLSYKELVYGHWLRAQTNPRKAQMDMLAGNCTSRFLRQKNNVVYSLV